MQDFEDRPVALVTGAGIEPVDDGVWLLHGQGQSFVADVGGGLLVVDSGPGGRITAGMIEALRTQEIRVDVSEMREDLLRVKSGVYTFDEIKRRALGLDEEFQREFERTTLPDQPDVETVDAFLIEARRTMV